MGDKKKKHVKGFCATMTIRKKNSIQTTRTHANMNAKIAVEVAVAVAVDAVVLAAAIVSTAARTNRWVQTFC